MLAEWRMVKDPTRYVMFLRGINVGGHRKMPMADLRALITDVVGDPAPTTYVASGNAVFTSDIEADDLALNMQDAIVKRFGFEVPVKLMTQSELADVLKACPWPDADGKTLHAFFCFGDPQIDSAEVDRWSSQSEEVVVKGRVVWLLTPNGFGKSKLAERLKLGTTATGRNLNTLKACEKLLNGG